MGVMALASCAATALEKRRPLQVDGMIPDPMFTSTHAITIDAPAERVWPWIVQMGAGRAGWYSWDRIDNGGTPSSASIRPELQRIVTGDIMPAVPGATDAFVVAAVDPPRELVLTAPDGQGGNAVAWEHLLEPLDRGRTRLIVRGRASSHWVDLARTRPPAGHHRIFIERVYAVLATLPRPLLIGLATLGHRMMEARHLRGIQRRSSGSSAFKTPEGEAAYLSAYNAALKLWPVPYDELDIPTRFGTTHVIASGPSDAPPLVLLHGYMATSAMWSLNIADFSKAHRVYAIDVMGQPSKSIPREPIRDRADFMAWLTATLDGLRLGSVSLVGMSFGGWIALGYAVAAPERVHKLVLLSVGGFLPMARQFTLRGMLMVFLPTRFTVSSFMHWLGIKENLAHPDTRRMGDVVDLTYLGLKHFLMAPETARVMPTVFSDGELRSIQMPTLVLFGDHEVICDPAAALVRALRLIPDCRGELISGPRHEMCVSHHHIVDARVLDFLKSPSGHGRSWPPPSL
jgi:pimeloyl-ACP methyl ester carboxylesterase